MLSDSLFDMRCRLLDDIRNYSSETWGREYPDSQNDNFIRVLYHMELAQMAYDSFEHRDDHTFTKKEKDECMVRVTDEYEKAIQKHSD